VQLPHRHPDRQRRYEPLRGNMLTCKGAGLATILGTLGSTFINSFSGNGHYLDLENCFASRGRA
jgi:hypothetical protein